MESQAMPTPQAPTPTVGQTLPPQPPKSKKRPLDTSSNSKYYKVRAALKDVRPSFIEVLQTPDFLNSTAAHKIQEQMKHLVELCKQTTEDTGSKSKSAKVSEGQPLPGQSQDGQKPPEATQDTKLPDDHHTGDAFAKPSEFKTFSSIPNEKKQTEDNELRGTYIIGGSAFGWNFITYQGSHPVYHGVTKESFRASKAGSQG